MSINFLNRIFTSILLLIFLFLGLFTNIFLFLYLFIVTSIISFFEFKNLLKEILKKNKKKYLTLNIISFFYLIFFIYSGFNLYASSHYIFVFVILICIFSDTGGYLIGKLIGGKKLTKISPNKTISGSIGSFFFSLIPTFIFLYTFNDNYENKIINLVLISLFLSLICQLGDLFISYFKRKAKVKDTGSILPGHGGLLDRIDGIIFVIPAAYIINKIFN